MNNFSELLKKSRGKKSQRQVSAATGISQDRISRLENGSAKATDEEAALLARHYSSFDLLYAYHQSTNVYATAVEMCEHMGICVPSEVGAVALQIGTAIVMRTKRMMEYFRIPTEDEAVLREFCITAGQEMDTVERLARALRLLIFDVRV